jgi:type I restriction enzyme S subunit
LSATVPLGEVVNIRKGRKAHVVVNEPLNGALPYLQIDEVRGAKPTRYAEDINGVEVTPDDLCIVWDGANAGTVGYGVAGLIGSTVARLRIIEPSQWETRFIGRLLEAKFRELNDHAQARGATIPHVDKYRLQEIALPKIELQEQRRIAAILDKADAIRRKRADIVSFANDLLKSAYVHLVGYKHPDHSGWVPHRIEQVAEGGKGSMRTGPFGSALRHSEFVEEGIAVLGIDNAVRNRFAWGERRFITREKYAEMKRYRVHPGDVIITIMGTTGRSAVVPDDIPEAITTKHLATITCDRAKILPEFLSFAIHSDPLIISQIQQANKGAIMDGLNLSIIRRLEIGLPPLSSQKAFVRCLKAVRRLIAKGESRIGGGDELFESLTQRAFRGEL